MQRGFNNDIVRMEKKATNKVGLFFLMIAILLAGGAGTFYLYKHHDEFDWNIKIPWKEDKKSDEKDNPSKKEESSKDNNNSKLIVPTLKENIFNVGEHDTFEITDVKATDKGYVFTYKISANSSNEVKFICEKILIDGFDTSAKFEITVSNDSYQNGTFTIVQTELDTLNINSFQQLELFIKKTPSKESKPVYLKLIAFNNIKIDNTIKGLVKIDEKNSTIISYYQKIEDKDYTYLYFDIKNQDEKASEQISVKKLIINNKLYTYKDLKDTIYKKAEKVIYIKIPKKEVKKVNKFTVSFFLIEENEKKENRNVYISNEYTKEY